MALVTADDDSPMSLTTDIDAERTETLPSRVVNRLFSVKWSVVIVDDTVGGLGLKRALVPEHS